MTVARLNELLNQIVQANQINEQIEVFIKFFEVSNAEEVKWITRIILKDLKLGIKIESVLNSFHPDAN